LHTKYYIMHVIHAYTHLYDYCFGTVQLLFICDIVADVC